MKPELEKFKGALDRLLEMPIWGTVAGHGTGSHVQVYLGGKVPLSRPLSNSFLQPDVRNFDGEYCLFVQGACWHIALGDSMVCSYSDSNLPGGAMLEGLDRIRNSVVQSTDVHDGGGSVEIRLSGGYRFLIESDAAFEEVDEDRFAFFTPSEIFFVDSEGRLNVEKRE